MPSEVTSRGSELWERIGPLFSDPDGDLPEIRIGGLTAAQVPLVAGLLQSHGAPLGSAVTWVPRDGDVVEVAMPMPDLEAAANEVVTGRRDPFHVVFTNVTRAGAEIPDLGMFVFQDEIAIDYEPGAAWTPRALEALCGLLCGIRRATPDVVIEYERHALERWRSAFVTAVAQYCDRAPAG